MKSRMQSHLDLACTRLEQQAEINEEQKMRMTEQERVLKEAVKTIEILQQRFASKRTNTVYKGELGYVYDNLKAGRGISSDPFYLKGYKMKIVVYTKFGVPNPPIWVGINVLPGKFDHEVKWPFESKVTVSFPDWFPTSALASRQCSGEVVINLCVPHVDHGTVTVNATCTLNQLQSPYRFIVELSD